VVLVKTRNPLNLGAVARAMSNFGAPELRAVRPYGKAWREARSAVGAGEVMAEAKEFPAIAEAVADCSLVVGTTSVGNRELKHPLRDLAEAAPLLREWMATGRVAVLFGSEKWGLSNEDLSYCHWLVRIPTLAEHRSMNLGQAAAVVLYELSRQKDLITEVTEEPRRARRHSEKLLGKPRLRAQKRMEHKAKRAGLKIGATSLKEEFASMETVERIGEALLEALVKSGYAGPRKPALAEEKLRRMLRRFSMEAEDAEVFLGMMRKIAAKIEQDAKK